MPKNSSISSSKAPRAFLLSLVLVIIIVPFNVFLMKKFHPHFLPLPRYMHERYDNRLTQIKQPGDYDYILFGTSHAGEIKNNGNVTAVQNILHKKIMVLADTGNGIVPSQIYLELFYDYHNTAKKIIFFVDAFQFHSKTANEYAPYYIKEQLDLPLIRKIFQHGTKSYIFRKYIQRNINILYLNAELKSTGPMNNVVVYNKETFDVTGRNLYHNPLDSRMDYYLQKLGPFIELARAHHTELVFIKPPTLVGNYYPQDQAIFNEKLVKILNRYDIKFYDHTNLFKGQYTLYRDPNHLNNAGYAKYFEEYIKPLLSD